MNRKHDLGRESVCGTHIHTDAFERLCSLLLNAPILVHPDFAKDSIVYSDASRTAFHGLLG